MIVLCLLVSLTALANGANLSGRVIGGSDAPDHKYPYLVSLRLRFPGLADFHFCGGAILDEHWILTAGHCFRHKDNNTYAVAGTNYLSEAGEGYKVWFPVLHPDYRTYHNDIALVRVVGSIKFNENVQPVGLPDGDITEFSSPGAFAGWGSIKMSGPSPNALQELPLTIVSNDVCLETHSEVTEEQICTLNVAGEGACHGDSGSPLVVDGVTVGLASYVRLPCASGYPDVFTRVSRHVDWIKEVQEKYETVIPQ